MKKVEEFELGVFWLQNSIMRKKRFCVFMFKKPVLHAFLAIWFLGKQASKDSGCRIGVAAHSVSAVTLALCWGLLRVCIPPTAADLFRSVCAPEGEHVSLPFAGF